MDLLETIPYIHIILTCYYLYPLIIPKNFFWDKVYLLVMLFVVFNWMILDGECVSSFIWKKMKDKNYKMGSNVLDLKDMKDLFPSIKERDLSNGFFIFMVFIFILFAYTANRSKILPFKLYSLITLSGIYISLRARKFWNEKIYVTFEKYYLIDIINVFITLLTVYTFYRVIKA